MIDVGTALAVGGPLTAVIYATIQLRLHKLEEKYVTRELFNERTSNQDKILVRIEKAMGILTRQYRQRHPSQVDEEEEGS